MPATSTAAARPGRAPDARRPAARGRAPARRPHLRLVGPARHTTRYVAALLLVGALGVFGIVSLSALAAEAAFDARALEREIEELALRYDDLTAEVAALESPARVRDVAIRELGMVPAEEAAYLVVDGPLDGPGTPGGATDRRGADVVPASHAVADPLKPALGTGG